MEQKRFHSVRLEGDKCRGCTNCLKRCPTEAIRVRGGRAHIIDERCIDCGECIRVCGYHAKVAVTDPLSSISGFKYKIALPAPSLYGQFQNLKSISQVLNGLKQMGFDDAFEVARGADVVSRAIRERLKNPDLPRPVISSACPAIVRLIQVRFPDLLDHIVDVRQPMEVAAMIAKREYARSHGVPEEEIGCFFITPCPAKVTAIRRPIGHAKSSVDGAISVIQQPENVCQRSRQSFQPRESPVQYLDARRRHSVPSGAACSLPVFPFDLGMAYRCPDRVHRDLCNRGMHLHLFFQRERVQGCRHGRVDRSRGGIGRGIRAVPFRAASGGGTFLQES